MTFASTADIKTLLGSAPGWRSAFKKLYVQVLIAIALGILLGHFYAEPCRRYEAAQRRLHHAHPRRRAADHLCHGRGRHRQDGRHAPGRRRRAAARSFISRSSRPWRCSSGSIVGNLLQPGAGLHIDPASLDEKAVAGYVTEREIADHRRFPAEDDPVRTSSARSRRAISCRCWSSRCCSALRCAIWASAASALVSLIDDFTHALFGIVRIVMYVAPLAAFGAMAFTIGKFGFGMLASLGQLLRERLSHLDPVRADRVRR